MIGAWRVGLGLEAGGFQAGVFKLGACGLTAEASKLEASSLSMLKPGAWGVKPDASRLTVQPFTLRLRPFFKPAV